MIWEELITKLLPGLMSDTLSIFSEAGLVDQSDDMCVLGEVLSAIDQIISSLIYVVELKALISPPRARRRALG